MRKLIRYFGRLLYVAIVAIERWTDLDNRILRYRQKKYSNYPYEIRNMVVTMPTLGSELLEYFSFLYPEYDGEFFYQVPFKDIVPRAEPFIPDAGLVEILMDMPQASDED